MKKTFPIIFALIALSILGILFIQITWLQGLFILSKNRGATNDLLLRLTTTYKKTQNKPIFDISAKVDTMAASLTPQHRHDSTTRFTDATKRY